ncbi:MAG TPA: non-ribosomal peptide synthetase [Terriglobales bacterium]|nr:non-ribosomal peptide synthetase [Terriglobales bacterium]
MDPSPSDLMSASALASARSVTDLVAHQAQLRPQALALRSARETLTYAELESAANRVARYLREKGVGPESIVAVVMDRSPSMVVAALAIMKAGGAYLPLDPSYPPARLCFMLNDAEVALVLTRECLRQQIPAGGWDVLTLNDPRLLQTDGQGAAREADSSDLAYVIYTSGSTGQPKGVQITQRSLLNLIFWHINSFGVTAEDRASQMASPSFDASVWEVWPYLAVGASVHFPADNVRLSAEPLRDWLLSEKITISFVPPVLAEQLIKLEWPSRVALRVLLTGADTLHNYPPSDLPFRLVNNYGPTECTVVSTSATVAANHSPEKRPPIGRPITNVQAYILDENLRPVPAGTMGELYIGGIGLARGYIRRPDLDALSFIPHPFIPGQRLYKTGDLACLLPDGQLAFGGRTDEQIKVRGYRIEPSEIVNALGKHPAVRAAAVVAREDNWGEKILVAYIVPATTDLDPAELRAFLRKQLPDYMVPGAFMSIRELPMTANGKLNRGALPDPVLSTATSPADPNSSPLKIVEQRLAEILEKLLGVHPISADDNFFLLGGHSLLGAQLIAQLRDAYGVELSLRSVFDFPTVRQLSAHVEQLILAKIDAMSPEEIERALAESATEEHAK